MNLTVTPSADALNLSVSADGTTYSLDVGTASPVNLSVSGGRGPAGIGNATLAAGNGITIGQSGNTATISSTRNSLGDLADVTLSSPSAGEVLTWNGTTWAAAADSTNLTGYATESYVDSAVANLVDSSPAALDTLNELAAAIGDDANFSATITASLAGKASLNHTHNIADVTGLQSALDAKAASGNYTLIGHTHTSANITDFATAAAANAPIQSVNCLTGDIVLVAGTGLTLGQLGTTLTLDADLPPSNLADLQDVSGSPAANQALIYNGTEWQPGDIPAGTTLNGLSGNLTFAAGDNVTLTVANSTLTFSASGGGVGSLDAGTFPRGDSLLAESGDTLTSETGDQLSPEQATSTSSAVIQLLRSNVAAAVPSSLAAGELAINTQDELLFYENSSGAVQSFPLRGYAVADHTHNIADVTGLQAALDAKAATASLANVATSGNYTDLAGLPTLGTAAATDATDYATAAQGTLADSSVQPADLATVATSGSYSDLSGIPSEFTPAAHTHTSADVTDFAAAAAANAPLQSLNTLTGTLTIAGSGGVTVTESGSTITVAGATVPSVLADLSDVSPSSPSAGEVLTWNGTAWAAAADSTNLTGYATESYVDSAVANLVDSSPAALDTLNELAAALGDDANFAANVTASLAGKASLNHTHAIADVTGLQAALDAKAATASLANVATSGNYTELANIPSEFTPTAHASSHATGGSDALAPSDIGAAPAASPTFTGTITVSAGTAAAPALVASGDSNTGLLFPAADTFAISTAGAERLRVTSNGYVGVNCDPAYRFHVAELGGTEFFAVGQYFYVRQENDKPCGFVVQNNNAVGGSSRGFWSFSIDSGNAAANDFLIYNSSVGASGNHYFTLTTDGDFVVENAAGRIRSNFFTTSVGAVGDATIDLSGQVLTISTAGTERLRVDSSGNVGIGTTSPSASLDINSDKIRLRTTKTPASAGDTGNAGDICWDSSYLYICTATDTWRRIAHSTW